MLKGVSVKGVRAIRYSTSAEDTDPASVRVLLTRIAWKAGCPFLSGKNQDSTLQSYPETKIP